MCFSTGPPVTVASVRRLPADARVTVLRHHAAFDDVGRDADAHQVSHLPLELGADLGHVSCVELGLRLRIWHCVDHLRIARHDGCNARTMFEYEPCQRDHLLHTGEVVERRVATCVPTLHHRVESLILLARLGRSQIESSHTHQGFVVPDGARIPDTTLEDRIGDLADRHASDLCTLSECTPHLVEVVLCEVVCRLRRHDHRIVATTAPLAVDRSIEQTTEEIPMAFLVDIDVVCVFRELHPNHGTQRRGCVATVTIELWVIPHHQIDGFEPLSLIREFQSQQCLDQRPCLLDTSVDIFTTLCEQARHHTHVFRMHDSSKSPRHPRESSEKLVPHTQCRQITTRPEISRTKQPAEIDLISYYEATVQTIIHTTVCQCK